MSVSPRSLRDAMGSFATGITVITAKGDGNQPVGLTANSFNSVSLDPPLVLFSLDRGASCCDAFSEGKPFVVNILASDHQDHSNRFAAKSDDKFAGIEGAVEARNGCVALSGALARFECTSDKVHDGGDHLIIVGRVDHLEHRTDGEPLLFFRGGYHQIAD